MKDFYLKDGSSVQVRRLQRQDDRLLVEIFRKCSARTIYQRFLTGVRELTPAMAQYLADVDHWRRVALIAENGDEPLGVVRYEPTGDPDVVELGLIVVDEWQNRGLGRILLREVLQAARENGIHRFCGHVLAENRRMLHLMMSEGQVEESRTEAGVATVSFSIPAFRHRTAGLTCQAGSVS